MPAKNNAATLSKLAVVNDALINSIPSKLGGTAEAPRVDKVEVFTLKYCKPAGKESIERPVPPTTKITSPDTEAVIRSPNFRKFETVTAPPPTRVLKLFK